MLFAVSASDPVPVLEGMDEDMGFSLPPVLAEEKEALDEPEELEELEEPEEPEESAPRPQPRRQVCTHKHTHTKYIYNNLSTGQLKFTV